MHNSILNVSQENRLPLNMSDSQRENNYRVIYLEIFPVLSNPLVRSKEHKIIRLV